MKSCEVIAEYTNNGQVIPLKFKIQEDGESHVFEIKSIIELPQVYKQKDIKKFRCKFNVGDTTRKCELLFYKDNTRWVLVSIK